MTVNDFLQELKQYGETLLAEYGLDDCIEVCGQFRTNKAPTLCLKFHKDALPNRCNLGQNRKNSIQIIQDFSFFSKLEEVRTETKNNRLDEYTTEPNHLFLKQAKREMKALLDSKLSIKRFWAQLIILKED